MSRLLYLQLIEDGVRVDRVRAALIKAESESKLHVPGETKAMKRVIYLVKKALMDTDGEHLKLMRKKEAIRKAENEVHATTAKPK